MGKSKLEKVLASMNKAKEKRHEEEFEILSDIFKHSELQKKHKFSGRELNECLKRLQLKTAKVGEILQEHGKAQNGFYIIIQGSCSKHMPCVDLKQSKKV